MRKFTGFALILSALAALAPRAGAAPMVILSSPSDLAHLTVGQNVEVDVTLQGLDPGHFIFNLFTQVLFPSSQLQRVSGPTPSKAFGSVFFGPDAIADPQLADFNANSGALASGGGVFGKFVDQTASGVGAIGQNGLFYSFVLRAIASGSGTIGFDLVTPNVNQFSGTDSVPPFAFSALPVGPPLTFTITAVPEPSALALVALALPVGFLYFGRGRRRSAA